MPSDKQFIQLLSELTKLTSKGEIVWRSATPPRAMTEGTNDLYPYYFEASYKSQSMGLAKRRSQAYDGERDRYYWDEELVFIFIDVMGDVVWEGGRQWKVLGVLFEAVRNKVGNVDGIFQNLLGTEEEEEEDDEPF